MAANDFKTIAGGSGANVTALATYQAYAALLANGYATGAIPTAMDLNRILRQTSIPGAVLTQFIADWSGADSVDDGTTATLLANLKTAVNSMPSEVGKIGFYATNSAPSGWLAANGAAVSRTAYARLFNMLVTVAGFTPQAFTVTIANPGVFTKSGHGFTDNERLRLSTTGALPTGLNASTDYFVHWIDANTFHLALTPSGAWIVTTGSQSGTHSYTQSLWGLGDGSTTFNVPNLQDTILKGSGSARFVGTWQKGTLNSWDVNADGLLCTTTNNSSVLNDTQRMIGADDYATDKYIQCSITAVSNTTTAALPGSLPGYGASGITRPNNTAVLVCVKY